jgi:hypothetical protein
MFDKGSKKTFRGGEQNPMAAPVTETVELENSWKVF